METFQTFIAVFIIFAAAFYLLNVSVLKKNKESGCNSCSGSCGGCSMNNSSKCSHQKSIESDISKFK